MLEAPARVHAVVLKEAIAHGQRVEDVVVLGRTAGEWRELARTTCVGYQRILPVSGEVDAGEVDAVEVRFTSNRAAPVLAGAAVLGTLTR